MAVGSASEVRIVRRVLPRCGAASGRLLLARSAAAAARVEAKHAVLRFGSVQLQFLSNLRDLQSLVTKNIKKMPLNIDLSKDPFFVEMWELAEKSANEHVNAKYQSEIDAKKAEIDAKKAEIDAFAKSQVLSIENMLNLGRFSEKEIADLLVVPLAFVLDIQAKMSGVTPNKSAKSRKKWPLSKNVIFYHFCRKAVLLANRAAFIVSR